MESWLNPTVDPNERTPGTCYLGDPQIVNMSPVGLARFCTLRSWLSQRRYDDANGDAVTCGPGIAVPALVIGNLADDACTPSRTRRIYEAMLPEAVGIATDWLVRHDFAVAR